MNLLQIIQTDKEIPPKKFGGAERIVNFIDEIAKTNNINSKIVNAEDIGKIIKLLDNLDVKDDFLIVCHSDWITHIIAKKYPYNKILHYSHYPYSELASALFRGHFGSVYFENLYNSIRTWKYIFKYCFQIIRLKYLYANVVICAMSNKIHENLSATLKIENLVYLPNPILVKKKTNYTNIKINKFLCVGKIEYRKKQEQLQKYINKGLVTYVGPSGNSNFNFNSIDYLGEVSNDILEDLYYSHKGLILASDGEAMPQVLFEALARGMPVFCTKEASWDLKNSDSIFIFSDLRSLCNFINMNININADNSNTTLQINNLINADLYASDYLLPLFSGWNGK